MRIFTQIFNSPKVAWLLWGTKKYGNGGDLFSAFGHGFQLTKVDKVYLGDVCSVFYKQEGFNYPSEFIACWNKLHPRKGYRFDSPCWLHQFKRVV